MLRRLVDRLRRRTDNDQSASTPTQRDYAQEREDHRHAQLSEEDQAWGDAARQRERDKREREQSTQESE